MQSGRLDKDAEGSAIQDYLAEKTGQGTVPNIFIGEFKFSVHAFINYLSDFQALNIKEVRAIIFYLIVPSYLPGDRM